MAYPSKQEVTEIFSHMASGEYDKFFEHVSPNVDWTVMGTHPCAGRYHTLDEFKQKTLARLGAIMKAPGIQLAIRNVISGGEWAVVELVTNAVCKNDFAFDNCYSWNVRFKDNVIVEVRAYLDSWMVRQAILENEDQQAASHRADVPRVADLK